MSRPPSSAAETSNSRKTVSFAGTIPSGSTIRQRRESINNGLLTAMSEEDMNSFAGRVRQDQAQRQYLQDQAQQHKSQWQQEQHAQSHFTPTSTMASSTASQGQVPGGVSTPAVIHQPQQPQASTTSALSTAILPPTAAMLGAEQTQTAPQIPAVNNNNTEVPIQTTENPSNNGGTGQEPIPPSPHMRSFLNPPGSCGMYGYSNTFGAIGGLTQIYPPPGYQQPSFPTMIGPGGQQKPFLYHNPPMAAPSIQPLHSGAPSWTQPRESPFFANNHGSLTNPPPYITGHGQNLFSQPQMMVPYMPMVMAPTMMVGAQVPAVMCAVPVQQQPTMGGGGYYQPPGPNSVHYFL